MRRAWGSWGGGTVVSNRMELLLTLLILLWLCEKFGERLISCKIKVERAPHSADMHPPPCPPDFFLWGVPQGQHLPGQLLHHWMQPSRRGVKRSPMRNVHVLSRTLHSTEWRTTGACTLGLILRFLVYVCG